jgi:hypothetical protein
MKKIQPKKVFKKIKNWLPELPELQFFFRFWGIAPKLKIEIL